VWLDTPAAVQGMRHGVLCRRHADAMVVPLGWMLDDRREPTPRLFTSPAVDVTRSPTRRERRVRDLPGEQLTLEPRASNAIDTTALADVEAAVPAVVTDTQPDLAPGAADELAGSEIDQRADVAWLPVFDPDDDLHGLLKARGRLLSRAFNGAPTERH